MTLMPVWTGISCSARDRPARAEPSETSTRCDTSSAALRWATNWAGMPSRWVTMRAMSTASLAMRSVADTTCSTDDMPSESLGSRTAMTHTARMSCTRSLIRSSSPATSSAMSGSPKYRAA